MIIAVDFDGTCVDHRFPEVGPSLPGAVATLQALIGQGHKLILWTMRSGEHQLAAEQWFRDNEIGLWGIQGNPEQSSWTSSPKAYAQLYIDDAAFGAPLVQLAWMKRKGIDWDVVRARLLGAPDGMIDSVLATLTAEGNAEHLPAELVRLGKQWTERLREFRNDATH